VSRHSIGEPRVTAPDTILTSNRIGVKCFFSGNTRRAAWPIRKAYVSLTGLMQFPHVLERGVRSGLLQCPQAGP
jgi:hypothetical protein